MESYHSVFFFTFFSKTKTKTQSVERMIEKYDIDEIKKCLEEIIECGHTNDMIMNMWFNVSKALNNNYMTRNVIEAVVRSIRIAHSFRDMTRFVSRCYTVTPLAFATMLDCIKHYHSKMDKECDRRITFIKDEWYYASNGNCNIELRIIDDQTYDGRVLDFDKSIELTQDNTAVEKLWEICSKIDKGFVIVSKKLNKAKIISE